MSDDTASAFISQSGGEKDDESEEGTVMQISDSEESSSSSDEQDSVTQQSDTFKDCGLPEVQSDTTRNLKRRPVDCGSPPSSKRAHHSVEHSPALLQCRERVGIKEQSPELQMVFGRGKQSPITQQVLQRKEELPLHISDEPIKQPSARFSPVPDKRMGGQEYRKKFHEENSIRSAGTSVAVVDLTSGINPTTTHSVAVTFHVIVPLHHWLWDESSSISLRFGNSRLGDWKEDVGLFKLHEKLEGMHWMKCTLNIDIDVLRREAIPYKYVISSPSHEDSSAYEVLQNQHGNPNRCLLVPNKSCTSQGAYSVYDGMTFPEIELSVLGRIRNFFTSKEEGPPKIPNHSQAQEDSLLIFLGSYEKKLKELSFSKNSEVNFLQCVNGIYQIYEQLRCQKILKAGVPWPETRMASVHLSKVFRVWLVGIANYLTTIEANNPSTNARRMCSALVILSLLRKLLSYMESRELDSSDVSAILSLLCLKPKTQLPHPQCLEMEFLFSYIPQNHHSDLAKTIGFFIKQVLENDNVKKLEWVYAIPLVHFLSKKARPFDVPAVAAKRISWDYLGLAAAVKRSTAVKVARLVATKSEDLWSLTSLDPLLLPLLVKMCPPEELADVFSVLPPYLSTAYLLELMKTGRGYGRYLKPLVASEIPRYTILIASLTQSIKEFSFMLDEIEAILEEVEELLGETVKRLESPNQKASSLLHCLLTLLLYSALKYKECCSLSGKVPAVASSRTGAMFKRVKKMLADEWVVKHYSSSIGGSNRNTSRFCRSAKEDLEAFNGLVKIDCPSEFEHMWCREVLQAILQERVARTSNHLKIELMSVLESMEAPHVVTSSVIVGTIVSSFDSIGSRGSDQLQQLYAKTKKYQKVVGEVLSKMFAKEFPRGVEKISTTDLLKWDMWPTCISIYRNELVKAQKPGAVESSSGTLKNIIGFITGSGTSVESGSEFCLPAVCTEYCSMADRALVAMQESIVSGAITCQEMQSLSSASQLLKVERLCAVNQEQYSLDAIKSSLKIRSAEHASFVSCRNALELLCQDTETAKLKIQGLSELKAEIRQDVSKLPMSSLCCTAENSDIQYTCFKSAQPLLPMLQNFTHLHDCQLFQNMWMTQLLNSSKAKNSFTFAAVVDKLWQPVFEECARLIDSIQSRSIKLKYIDHYFGCLGSQELLANFRALYVAMEQCHGRVGRNPAWIRLAVDRMHQYWSLCAQAKAAKVVLKLKKKMGLAGDFRVIEEVASEIAESMKDSTLDDIDQTLTDAKSFLEEFSKDSKKLKCLKSFSDCMNIVEWIRKVSKEVTDLHNFVNVALHTAAGEGDLSSDKLSHLQTVGSGFGPLIYGLKSSSGFSSFQKRCKAVWKAMEKTPNLPQLLVSCNNELEWYKFVKNTQASVEVSSYSQMDNIFQFGCYTVGSAKWQICQHYDEIIHLTLRSQGACKMKEDYNLEELRDLESKLVLITGSKAENRARVDTFIDTLHSVCRIAEVLLTLQQVGNVKYTGWLLQVPCSADREVIHQLQAQAKVMEDELCRWRARVRHERDRFYELNYFTTLQLLKLRSEFGRLKSVGQSAVVAPDILALLRSISMEVSPKVVTEVVFSVDESEVSCAKVAEDTSQPQDEELPSAGGVEANKEREDVCESKKSSVKATQLDRSFSVKQREMMANICSRLACSKLLVAKAFEECCGDKCDQYDYESWCVENMEKYSFLEEEEEEGGQSDTEAMEVQQEFKYSQDDSRHCRSPTAVIPSCPVIKEAIRECVDEHHSVVASLVKADYSLEDSIEAVVKCRTLEGALHYLEMAATDKAQDSGNLIPMSGEQQISTESSQEVSTEGDWSSSGPVIYPNPEAEKKYLKLELLGAVLRHLSKLLPGGVPRQRQFSTQFLQESYPNVLVVQPDQVLTSVLHIYMEHYSEHPLPSPEEVLICNSATTAEQVELLWMRAVNDPCFKRIFCLVHAEKLSYQVSDQALSSLSAHTQGRHGYRLVIVCSNEEESKSHFISKLHLFRRPFVPPTDVKRFKHYLASKFSRKPEEVKESSSVISSASTVDCENSCARIVMSDRSGMGKSLYIQHLAKELRRLKRKSPATVHVTIPLHGPLVTPDTLLELFQNHLERPTCCIYHIDIAPSVLWQVDTLLFSLLILRGLSDSQGRMWRCHPNQLYAVEVTLPNRSHIPEREKDIFPEKSTISLLNLLPSVTCLSPRKVLAHLSSANQRKHDVVLMDAEEFSSASYQRVYQYILCHYAGHNLDTFSFKDTVEGTPQDCLHYILYYCGVQNPSWSEVHHFVKFFDLQLQSCEDSVFLNPAMVGDVLAGMKNFVVKFMIQMSRDFSTSSLRGEVAMEMNEALEGDDINIYQINERKQWEQSAHPYIFFNQDRATLTFVGFTITPNGDLFNPSNQQVLEQGIMTPGLYNGLRQNNVNFQEDCRGWKKPVMIKKLAMVMGLDYVYDPDDTYVLTVDNMIKILAIQMRFRCGIPVVIMGETGCGKTRLIRYMCDLARQCMNKTNMMILKVHGGTTEEDITAFIGKAEEKAVENRTENLDTVVFFDEANTTDAISLIKEIMCDRRINGKPVSADLKFIAACNPYRKHTDDMIQRLETAGLGFFVRATETQQKLGKIPLRQLVYRVWDLPPSMRPLVYDFGQLNPETECNYIHQIVSDHIRKHAGLSKYNSDYNILGSISQVLVCSQQYMRQRKDECSFVSLRDVERAMIVFEYMYDMMAVLGPLMDEFAKGEVGHIDNEETDKRNLKYQSPGGVVRALVLALSVCYHARLHRREGYENCVVRYFTGPIALPGGEKQFRDEIRWCQEVLLDSMQLGDNIARNAALRENVFMMAICVELKIPLFLVGKPGSSKSLAKSIISESMRGEDSKKELLKKFKEVGIFSYQCSQLSTSKSVIEVFRNAQSYQKKRSSYVAVVVLDEVGLAEDSPYLPLKALHPLLEDGTEGASKEGFADQIVSRQERVAFIGISNWALDPAKMNRGVMVTRADPSEDELVFSARGICSNKDNDPIRGKLNQYFRPFAKAYINICLKQKRVFFGLRDFYSLIKMLYHMCERSGLAPTWPQLEHAIKRNFGGLESEDCDPFQEFMKQIPRSTESMSDPSLSLINPDCSRLGLIRASLNSQDKNYHGENRYVLFLTENYAALDILKNPKNYLTDELSLSQNGVDNKPSSDIQPFILFGSSFPKDKEYTQVCRNINQIKICMETGRTVILLNLENLYESLYDVLNQYYIYLGDSKYVDLGLQTHRVRCRVHRDFKLILIAEKDTVYENFPTPLINRLEKHFVLTSSILESWQEGVLNEFEDWIDKFSSTGSSKFAKGDAFVGFQKDTPASVIFQATHLLRSACALVREHPGALKKHTTNILKWSELDTEHSFSEDEETWKQAVLRLSKFLLLQTASPDAVVRLQYTSLACEKAGIEKIYFIEQCHGSIQEFLGHHLADSHHDCGKFMQVTTHSHLLSHQELRAVEDTIKLRVDSFFLNEFDTELDFSNKVGSTFKLSEGGFCEERVVVIQCDSGHVNGDLIACARNRIYDLKAKADDRQITHILFIIHLPHHMISSSFVGFQGDPWESSHVDDLRPSASIEVMPHDVIGSTISELFLGTPDSSHPIQDVSGMDANGPSGEEANVSVEMLSDDEEKDGAMRARHFGETQHHEVEEMETEMEGVLSSHQGESRETFLDDMETEPSDAPLNSSTDPHKVANSKAVTFNNGHHPADEELPVATPVVPCTNSPLYRRLHSCIYAAASKLKDFTTKRSTKRVEILVRLIPPETPSLPDSTEFHRVLVHHMSEILREKDKLRPDEKEWVINEAMNPKSLQHGGTFRNVLSRKVDNVIVPIFSEIISVIDQNYNLDLIDPRNEDLAVSQFWLSVFHDPGMMQFCYTDTVNLRKQVPGVGGRKALHDFQCEMPFLWLIHSAVQSQWDNSRCSSDDTKVDMYQQLCAAVEGTVVGELLSGVTSAYCDDLYLRYLHDFVRLEHMCNQKDLEFEKQEYELISSALDALVHGNEFSSSSVTLIQKMSSLHVVHEMYAAEVLWFGQLVALSPGIMVHLKKEDVHNKTEMILHLCAVKQALISLVPPLDKNNPATSLSSWLSEVRLSRNAIVSIFSLPSQSKIKKEAWLKWGEIQVLLLLLEHVLLKHPFERSVAYLIRLHHHLKRKNNFIEVATLKMLQSQLNLMNREVKQKRYVEGDQIANFERNCQNYFIAIVSNLCFGGKTVPEPALIKMIMDIVFTKSDSASLGTRAMTPAVNGKIDEVPVVRSSLLQLLLEHNSENVKHHLRDYFTHCQQALSGCVDENLSLLCIQCFEDALYKRNSYQVSRSNLSGIINILNRSYQALKAYKSNSVVDIAFLEGVAGARFSLMEVASILESQLSRSNSSKTFGLVKLAMDVCTDQVINTTKFSSGGVDITGPAVYLIKLLVRQFGFPCLKSISERHQWIIPRGLRKEEQDKVMDPFVVYQDSHYLSIRDIVSDAAFGRHSSAFENVKEGALLLLALYEVITLSYSSQNRPDFGNQLYAQVERLKLPAPMHHVAKALVTNQQGGPLAQMVVQPGLTAESKILGAIVIHTVTVLSSNLNSHLLLPFKHMLTSPKDLENSYLPTMADDDLQEMRKIVGGGQWYECSRGHPYHVGECGQPMVEQTCKTCGAKIGGRDHKLRQDNRRARNHDATQVGHVLGDPDSRTALPAPERGLSRAAVCIVRALMHSAFIWCSCHYLNVAGELAALVTPRVNPNSLPEYFWRHLQRDIAHLSRVTGKGFDQSTIIVHLVLRNILKRAKSIHGSSPVLTCKKNRVMWEEAFNTHFIQPVLENLDVEVNAAMNVIANDKKHDLLFSLAYEKTRISEGNIEPHLWSYRQRISLEHLGQTLQEKKLKATHPILYEFLRVEPSLRATQYLPDIVKLQRSFYDAFHHRLDRKDAKTKTIGQYLDILNSGPREQFIDRIESLKKAWDLVGKDLKTHGRLRLEDSYYLPTLSKDVLLEYFIPTTTGPGALTTSLVDYLILTHNDFISKCSTIVADSSSQRCWAQHKVPITHIQRCHLLDYEHHIVPVVLSHCCYSLRVGEAHTVQYDYEALEKHILDKFIYGKPTVLSEIPQVVYRKDIYTIDTFDAVRKKVKPQVKLDSQVKKEILSELRTPDRLRENLDLIDIVLGFLSSGGGKAEKSLAGYIDKVLKMKKKPFSQKAREYCKLQHILSLWKTLSVELAKLTWLRCQEPFESLHEKYLRELSESNDDNQVAALDKCLKTFDLDRLLEALFEFVETYVKYSPDTELKWPVKDVITEGQFDHLELENQFSEFPDSITLDQVVSVWKHTVLYQQKLKH